ncbi:MAG: hypothetical protein HY904_10030 [Deltaproteobacteria bacterium]|nr:hypothetical protein [Deltaproteobacteria bacterium]
MRKRHGPPTACRLLPRGEVTRFVVMGAGAVLLAAACVPLSVTCGEDADCPAGETCASGRCGPPAATDPSSGVLTATSSSQEGRTSSRVATSRDSSSRASASSAASRATSLTSSSLAPASLATAATSAAASSSGLPACNGVVCNGLCVPGGTCCTPSDCAHPAASCTDHQCQCSGRACNNGNCVPLGGCCGDANCPAGQWCNGGACACLNGYLCPDGACAPWSGGCCDASGCSNGRACDLFTHQCVCPAETPVGCGFDCRTVCCPGSVTTTCGLHNCGALTCNETNSYVCVTSGAGNCDGAPPPPCGDSKSATCINCVWSCG